MNSSVDSAGAELRIVCGPTAAGKSALAMALGERHGLTIVSADSRQIYRGFDIGTAKPPPVDRARVRHLGVDVADPAERWSAARWAKDAGNWILSEGSRRVVIVGGTGLYLRALVAPLFDGPPLDEERRGRLALALGGMTTSELGRWVGVLDPARARLGRTQLLRAAEVALLTGQRISDLQRAGTPACRFRARWLVVDPGRGLHARIERRIDRMLADGWADEVRALDAAVPADAPAWQGCGYRAMREMVRGTLGAAEAREAILIATRQYAKRQRTWFRHQLATDDVTRVDPHDPTCEATVEAWWSAGESE